MIQAKAEMIQAKAKMLGNNLILASSWQISSS
jgi:hypothetical protein